MNFHKHRYDHPQDYLHHRAPYLLVDEVVSIEENRIVTRSRLSGDEFFISGHFPGAPILPGAMMQEMTTQSAGILIAAEFNPMSEFNTSDPFFNEYALGVLVRVKSARFKGFVRPGDELTIEVDLDERVGQLFDFRALVSVGEQRVLVNSFQLINIPSKTLQGISGTAS